MLDLIDYSDLILEYSFIIFLDFYKAFDSVEHEFLFLSLEKFGFEELLCSTIKTVYMNGNRSFKLMHGTSPRFENRN